MSKNPLLWGALGRCPNCGKGALFHGFLTVAPDCAACGYDLRAADSGDGPAGFVVLIAGFGGAFGALIPMVAYRPSVAGPLAHWLPLPPVIARAALRPTRAGRLA